MEKALTVLVGEKEARRLCEKFGGPRHLSQSGGKEWGLTEARARRLRAALDLGIAACADDPGEVSPIMTSYQVYGMFADLGASAVEEFWCLYLDVRNRPIRREMIHRGGLTSCIIDAACVLRGALLAGATSFIVVHNHPSGDPSPSPDDCQLTRDLKTAADAIGLKMLDHVVIGAGRYRSMCEEGMMHGKGATC